MNFELLTKDEVADRVRVPVRYLEAEIRAGRGPAVTRIGERKTRIRSDMFEEWLRRRTVQPATADLCGAS